MSVCFCVLVCHLFPAKSGASSTIEHSDSEQPGWVLKGIKAKAVRSEVKEICWDHAPSKKVPDQLELDLLQH